MSSEQKSSSVWGFIKGFGKLLIGFLLLVQGVIGLVVMLLFVGLIVSFSDGLAGGGSKKAATVPQDAALLINPNGVLVEESEAVDPIEQAFEDAFGSDAPRQIEVHELVRAVRSATTDDRIKGIVLDLGELGISPISASKIHDFAAELRAFKAAGKKIVAVGDYYSQEQYLAAAEADEIYMHREGALIISGYGSYNVFLKSFLDKLLVTANVFRVGTFKAAVEPFLRDDMSPESEEANLAYISSLWRQYVAAVEAARELPAGSIDRFANQYNDILRAAGGDFAKAALDNGLIDGVKTRAEQEAILREAFGAGEQDKGFKNVSYDAYLTAVGEDKATDAPDIAIVVAAGTIVDGDAPAGTAAGGDTISGYLKKAREDENVKAVVLRVDSPGGSVFASEVIREEVVALKAAGKPVVVSMGSLAASGGYWISAPADEIWAAPTTITGSIGIFGFIPTFEKAAQYWGVSIDGVGTTALSPAETIGLAPIDPLFGDLIQQNIEHGYRNFLGVVAEGRDLETSYVDEIGQGRVWIGERAIELKLVDKIGSLDDAVASAARLANIETYDRVRMIEKVSPFQAFFGTTAANVMKAVGFSRSDAMATNASIRRLVSGIERQLNALAQYNDPNAVYARCVACGQ